MPEKTRRTDLAAQDKALTNPEKSAALDRLGAEIFGSRFVDGHHEAGIKNAFDRAIAAHGADVFGVPTWHIGTSDFRRYDVTADPQHAYSVPLTAFVSWRDCELFLSSMRYERERGVVFDNEGIMAAVGWSPGHSEAAQAGLLVLRVFAQGLANDALEMI